MTGGAPGGVAEAIRGNSEEEEGKSKKTEREQEVNVIVPRQEER